MLKKVIACALALAVLALAGGCAQQNQKYSVVYWDVFDTVVTITGYASSQAQFDQAAEAAHAELVRLDALFDCYEEHPGVNGVWALNHAQGQPLKVDGELIDLIDFCAQYYETARRRVNIALGRVLAVWSRYRQEGVALPGMDELSEAARDADPGLIEIDREAGAVRLAGDFALDLGAVGKGYAVERAAQLLDTLMPSYLIDAGGNIRAGTAPLDGRSGWSVGLLDPVSARSGGQDILSVVEVAGLCVVTSGGYQRYYTVDGVDYHHIIDPDTLMPGGDFLQVSVVARDSALADYLSTALFLMDYESGLELVDSLNEVGAIWVTEDGQMRASAFAAAQMKN